MVIKQHNSNVLTDAIDRNDRLGKLTHFARSLPDLLTDTRLYLQDRQDRTVVLRVPQLLYLQRLHVFIPSRYYEEV